MKRYFLLLSLFILSSQLFAQRGGNPVDYGINTWHENLNGKIKSVEISMLFANPNQEDKRLKSMDLFFNEKGQKIEERRYRTDGKTVYVFQKWNYDKKGNVETMTEHRPEYKKEDITSYKEGRPEKTKYLKDGIFEGLLKYEYSGNEREDIYEDAEGKAYYTQRRKFDEHGNETHFFKKTSTDEEGRFRQTYDYVYSSNGHIIKETLFQTNEKIAGTAEYKYDDLGRTIEYKYYMGNSNYLEKHRIYRYDEQGNLTAAIYGNTDGANGMEIGDKFTYEYDDKGNWIKRKKGSPMSGYVVIERKITY